MDISDTFRKNARECLTRAQEAPSLESRTHWLMLGRAWFDLAQHAEEREMFYVSAGPPLSPASDPAFAPP